MSVSLVGAGPGDPELITVRGLARVRAAEVLVHDRLVADELVAEASAAVLRIPRDGLDQDAVNALLVEHGRRGRRVVRLKGGDPFLFGRGGEEALALVRARVPFELVPGVSALASVPASAGIPVTHRGAASAVTAFAAHDVEALDAAALARTPGTLVAFMSGAVAGRLAERLIAAGKPAATPAAVVARGTRDDERVVTACRARPAATGSRVLRSFVGANTAIESAGKRLVLFALAGRNRGAERQTARVVGARKSARPRKCTICGRDTRYGGPWQ